MRSDGRNGVWPERLSQACQSRIGESDSPKPAHRNVVNRRLMASLWNIPGRPISPGRSLGSGAQNGRQQPTPGQRKPRATEAGGASHL